MDVTRLRTLRELSLRKTMAAVAGALRLSPSAVSQQIALLEADLGVELVQRRGRGVCLTPAGERLVQHAGRVVGILEEAKTDIAELKRVVAGELRVAAFPSVAATLIPQTIRRLEQMHPLLRITFEELEPMDGLAALRAWQTDVALVDDLTTAPGIPEDTVAVRHVLDDALYAILAPTHPLAKQPSVSFSDLRHERWALDTASHTYSDVIVGACRGAGFEPVINGNCHGFEVVRALVEAGCSISIQPGLRVRHYVGALSVKELAPAVRRRISVAFRRGESRHPAIGAFLDELAVSAGERAAEGVSAEPTSPASIHE